MHTHLDHQQRTFDPQELGQRFAHAFSTLAPHHRATPEQLQTVAQNLLNCWSEPHRVYHGRRHLLDGLTLLQDPSLCPLSSDQSAAVELAWWYHDVVHQPGHGDSEKCSAQRWQEDAASLGMAQAHIENIAQWILGTQHHQNPNPNRLEAFDGAAVLRDLDLAILGRDPVHFMDYEYGIREEYGAMNRIRFAVGRGDFLNQLCQRTAIYHTPTFADRFEERARTNIQSLLTNRYYRAFRWYAWFRHVTRRLP